HLHFLSVRCLYFFWLPASGIVHTQFRLMTAQWVAKGGPRKRNIFRQKGRQTFALFRVTSRLTRYPEVGRARREVDENARSFVVVRGSRRPTRRIRSTPAFAACKIFSW